MAFSEHQGPPPGAAHWPAVLVLADMSVAGSHVNGTLLDMQRRGVCVVYAGSHVFASGDSEKRFEIFVHELGHMVNLSHRQADESFPTAMDSFDRRNGVGDDRVELWTEAIDGAAGAHAAKLRAFFGDGQRRPIGLPMSSRCCEALATPLLSRVEPWGEPFDDTSAGAQDDQARPVLRCTIELQTIRPAVAQPLDLAIALRLAPGTQMRDVPCGLDLHSGLLVLDFVTPSGESRRYLPARHDCGTLMRRLRPGQVVRRNHSLLADSAGLMLAEPGRYRLRAGMPEFGVYSEWLELQVAAASGVFAEASFQEFLRRGLPQASGEGWRQVGTVLASPDVAEPTKAHLAVRGAAQGQLNFQPVRRLRRFASPRVTERDALLRVLHLLRAPGTAPLALHRAIDDAERILRTCDREHPTLEYLTYVRRSVYLRHVVSRRPS